MLAKEDNFYHFKMIFSICCNADKDISYRPIDEPENVKVRSFRVCGSGACACSIPMARHVPRDSFLQPSDYTFRIIRKRAFEVVPRPTLARSDVAALAMKTRAEGWASESRSIQRRDRR